MQTAISYLGIYSVVFVLIWMGEVSLTQSRDANSSAAF
jgi:hypothetical protein